MPMDGLARRCPVDMAVLPAPLPSWWGRASSDAEVSADTVAFTRATNSWEVFQQLSGRLSRVYMWGRYVIDLRKESRTQVNWVPDTTVKFGDGSLRSELVYLRAIDERLHVHRQTS